MCSPSFAKCEYNAKRCVKVLHFFEFTVHPEKAVFTPTKCIEYFGFTTDSGYLTISFLM